MKAYIDIENSKTKIVEQIIVPLIEYNKEGTVKFDISSVNDHDLEILKMAIDKNLQYTDVEMFFTDVDDYPNYGPDYEFKIYDDILEGIYIRNIWLSKRRK